MNSIRIDLHTHSVGSPDGGVTLAQYKALIESNVLQYIAITDHDRIDVAQEIHSQLGDAIIIGQEITTQNGEIIGLFLKSKITPGLTAKETAEAIRDQGGLVYIPHPFETVRKGITKEALDPIASLVDIVEVHNGRAVFQNKGPQAAAWARLHNTATAASSDAHGVKGMATSFSVIDEVPTAKTLAKLLEKGRLQINRPPLRSLLYPKYNRLRGTLKRK